MEARGALLDGRAGRAYPSCAKVWRAISSTWWICVRRRVPLPYALSGAGLWCFCCQFRRPAFSCLEKTWEVLEESTPSRERRRVLAEEFMLLAMIVPLLVIDWRVEVSSLVTCSDASEQGGGVVASRRLSGMGARDFEKILGRPRNQLHGPVLGGKG